MYTVKAYTIWNTTQEWGPMGLDKAREFAKRMIMEGLWYTDADENEVFVPITNLTKVKVLKQEAQDEQ